MRSFLIGCGLVVLIAASAVAQTVHRGTVFPGERRVVTDAQTGAELVFLTTGDSTDTNLYFHDRS